MFENYTSRVSPVSRWKTLLLSPRSGVTNPFSEQLYVGREGFARSLVSCWWRTFVAHTLSPCRTSPLSMEPCFKLTFNAFIICRETSHLTLIFLGGLARFVRKKYIFGEFLVCGRWWLRRVNLSWLICLREMLFYMVRWKWILWEKVSAFKRWTFNWKSGRCLMMDGSF